MSVRKSTDTWSDRSKCRASQYGCGCRTTRLSRTPLCAAASRPLNALHAAISPQEILETNMYIGGGLLGAILVVALIVYVLRRA